MIIEASKPLARHPAGAGAGGERPLDLLHPERLDPVADLEVVVVLDADAALESLAHFPDVVLEALEAGERAGVHRASIADDPRLGGALDDAVPHRAARDGAHLAHLEELQHLRLAQ